MLSVIYLELLFLPFLTCLLSFSSSKEIANTKTSRSQEQVACVRCAYAVLPLWAWICPPSPGAAGAHPGPRPGSGADTAHENELPPCAGSSRAVHRLLSCKAAQ